MNGYMDKCICGTKLVTIREGKRMEKYCPSCEQGELSTTTLPSQGPRITGMTEGVLI